MPHEFELRKEITLQATPEQVWEAIATGPGIDGWFMGRNEVEPREGGRTAMTIGPSTPRRARSPPGTRRAASPTAGAIRTPRTSWPSSG